MILKDFNMTKDELVETAEKYIREAYETGLPEQGNTKKPLILDIIR